MSAEKIARITSTDRPVTAAQDFAKKFTRQLDELTLSPGIRLRMERLLVDFSDTHPNLRASYISRSVDESYFSDGECGWEASARPQLHGLAIEGTTLFEFIAFTNGFRQHSTPIETVINIEELWLEPLPEQPFVLRVSLYHSFPATTILYAPTGETQDTAMAFAARLKYLRGW